MTTDQMLETILTRLTDMESQVARIHDRITDLENAVDNLGSFDQAAFDLHELASDARRRELAEIRDGARAAMRRAS